MFSLHLYLWSGLGQYEDEETLLPPSCVLRTGPALHTPRLRVDLWSFVLLFEPTCGALSSFFAYLWSVVLREREAVLVYGSGLCVWDKPDRDEKHFLE